MLLTNLLGGDAGGIEPEAILRVDRDDGCHGLGDRGR
jgi:hypothetical protein